MSSKSIKEEEEVIALAKEIANKALDEVVAHTKKKKTQLTYACYQNKFDCTKKYDCKDPDECAQDFKCPNNYTAAC